VLGGEVCMELPLSLVDDGAAELILTVTLARQ
jgi:hypothetical protein